MSGKPVNTGFYGKIPSRGDFVQRGLPREFVRVWDEWLVARIRQSQLSLAEGWQEAFMTAPLWRFYLTAGLCGHESVCGVVLPSVDRVGRTFPLVLCRMEAISLAEALSQPVMPWFEAVEVLAFDVLEELMEPESIARRLQESESLFVPPPQSGKMVRFPIDSRSLPLSRMTTAALLAQVGDAVRGLSVWWSDGSQCVEPSVLWCRGMPAADAFSSMLVGQWSRFGCEQGNS
ncbi:MAG: type VI secretion system-associated protein TagF [Magnetococcus sp. DMHC-1]